MLGDFDYIGMLHARIGIALGCVLLSLPLGALVSVVFKLRPLPFIWFLIDRLFGRTGDLLNRYQSRPSSDVFIRGSFLICAGLMLTGVVLEALQIGVALVDYIPRWGLEAALLLSVLNVGSYPALLLAAARKGGDIARGVLSYTARIDVSGREVASAYRLIIGESAINVRDAFFMPLVLYIIFGIDVAMVAAVLSGFMWRFGRIEGAGAFMVLARVLLFLPERIVSFLASVYIFVAAVFVPKAVKSAANLPMRAHAAFGGRVLSVLAAALG